MSRLNSFRKKGKKSIFGKQSSFREQVVANFAGRNIVLLPESARPGAEKMSALILELIEPYQEFARTDEACNRLVVLGIMAWNIAVSPADERAAMIEELAATVPSSERPMFREFIEEMIERKLANHADNRRLIMDYTLTGAGDTMNLTVASTLPKIE